MCLDVLGRAWEGLGVLGSAWKRLGVLGRRGTVAREGFDHTAYAVWIERLDWTRQPIRMGLDGGAILATCECTRAPWAETYERKLGNTCYFHVWHRIRVRQLKPSERLLVSRRIFSHVAALARSVPCFLS